MTYTPKPWIFLSKNVTKKERYACVHFEYAIVNPDWGPNGTIVCKMIQGQDNDEMVSNAHLIAAAPQLLEACKEALEFVVTKNYENRKIANTLRAAIAAAEGE